MGTRITYRPIGVQEFGNGEGGVSEYWRFKAMSAMRAIFMAKRGHLLGNCY